MRWRVARSLLTFLAQEIRIHPELSGSPNLHLPLSSEAELEPLKEQLRGAQELAASSQQKAALLGEELASAAGARDRTMAELHRSRLEVAGVSGRLAELSLHLKEEKSQWSKERAGLLQSVEVEGWGPGSSRPPPHLHVARCPGWAERNEDLGGLRDWGRGSEGGTVHCPGTTCP